MPREIAASLWAPTKRSDPVSKYPGHVKDIRGCLLNPQHQARARYILKNNRPPPPNFDKWFAFARENKCLIDDYDQIHRDFEPFYRISEENSTHFQKMIGLGPGYVSAPNDRTYFDNEWRDRIAKFAHILPDMDVLVNGHDEPRVVFNTQDSDARLAATELRDNKPFRISPVNTSEFFTHRSGCSYVNDNRGFGASSLQDVGSLGFTTDLWPMLSFTKIPPVPFSDILFPSQIYLGQRSIIIADSWYTGNIKEPNRIPWAAKEPKLYWRGSSNGGHIIRDNYRRFPRFKLLNIAHAHPDLVDAAQMTDFWGSHCTFDCNSEPIIEEYDIGNHHSLPRETVHKFKYVLDGRYLGLFEIGFSGSTSFQEYFTDWLRPYEHYIPVKLDLSDLVDRARLIQQRGMMFAQEILTNEQNNCYFAAVLLEWARLQNAAAG
ncbi:hypothetical protein B0H14DRAFT_2915880 [Mycena olivaceomarginata]|nr:hypothetical protein B0H14DRAFT_2915880 [Mycena olivaceomarginata]